MLPKPNAEIYEQPQVRLDLKLPYVRDLAHRLRFSIKEGRIWLGERRVALLHVESLASLRDALIDAIGLDATRQLLTRIGYEEGQRDARMVRDMLGPDTPLNEVLNFGGTLHALQGYILPGHIGRGLFSGDLHSSDYYGEGYWDGSLEADAHLSTHGVGSHSACWYSVGHCSGYLSACAGQSIVVHETECRAMGHAHCRIVAFPAEHAPPEYAHAAAPGQMPAVLPATPDNPDDREIFVGTSAAFTQLKHKIERVAQTQATVLVLGESGTGKSLVAHEIHRRSRRAHAPFVEINCAAIPDTLIESELFGVERGAFSGATTSRVGRFEAAQGGTLFLDEIATLSTTAQGKLLRVLQSGTLERLGSNRTIQTDVRVIAATNEPLREAVRQGRFREDLYFRLNVFPIVIQPLRERREDIVLLTEVLLRRFARRHDRPVPAISPRALQALMHYAWPGNIRELENMLERGLIMVQDDNLLDLQHLTSVDDSLDVDDFVTLGHHGLLASTDELPSGEPEAALSVDSVALNVLQQNLGTLSEVEDALVRAALRQAGGNVSRAAGLLGLTRAQMDYRVKKTGVGA
ncbi:TPA: sigma 54-interacting transcriptional regulator [Burkholderia cepacia]